MKIEIILFLIGVAACVGGFAMQVLAMSARPTTSLLLNLAVTSASAIAISLQATSINERIFQIEGAHQELLALLLSLTVSIWAPLALGLFAGGWYARAVINAKIEDAKPYSESVAGAR